MSAPATAAKDALPDPEGMAAHIKRLVDAAPQCSAEQRDRLAAILCTPAAVRRGPRSRARDDDAPPRQRAGPGH